MPTTLDEMFRLVDTMNIPEGYHAEIIEGQIVVSPQRATHWTIIMLFTQSLLATFGTSRTILSDVRVDFPGERPGTLNGFAPDVALLKPDVAVTDRAHHSADLALVAEVVSRDSRRNDYGPKLETYARAGVDAYVIADPLTGLTHVHEQAAADTFARVRTYPFGATVEISEPALRIDTSRWPRDT